MKYKTYLLLLLILSLAAGCSKDKNNDYGHEDIIGSPVMILGEVDMTTSRAYKVMAISTTNTYKEVDIVNNHFSLQLDKGKPWGLVFLDSTEQSLGLLSLGNGVEAIPLHYMNAGGDTLDLGSIVRNTTIFTPSHNPIGNEILLTTEQQNAVADQDDYLAILLKNPDVDGNGIIDLLEGKFFKLSVIYFVHPGTFFNGALTPTPNSPKLITGYRLFLTVRDKNMPDAVYFTSPSGSPFSNTTSESYQSYTSERVYQTAYYQDFSGSTSCIPNGGTYTVKYGNSTLTFDLADQSYIVNNIVFPWPSMTLNSDGTMKRIDWNYQLTSGTFTSDLNALMRNIMVQVNGTGNKCGKNQDKNRLYDSDRLAISTTSHTFSCQNIKWEGIDFIMMTYDDHYGSTYVVHYERQ